MEKSLIIIPVCYKAPWGEDCWRQLQAGIGWSGGIQLHREPRNDHVSARSIHKIVMADSIMFHIRKFKSTCFVIVEESTTNKIPLEPGPYLRQHRYKVSLKCRREMILFHEIGQETSSLTSPPEVPSLSRCQGRQLGPHWNHPRHSMCAWHWGHTLLNWLTKK